MPKQAFYPSLLDRVAGWVPRLFPWELMPGILGPGLFENDWDTMTNTKNPGLRDVSSQSRNGALHAFNYPTCDEVQPLLIILSASNHWRASCWRLVFAYVFSGTARLDLEGTHLQAAIAQNPISDVLLLISLLPGYRIIHVINYLLA